MLIPGFTTRVNTKSSSGGKYEHHQNVSGGEAAYHVWTPPEGHMSCSGGEAAH